MPKELDLKVIKASGEEERYSRKKLERSLKNAGVKSGIVRNVSEGVEEKLFPGVSTKKIFDVARERILKQDLKGGTRYSLKKAIMEMGPAGYLFEKYISEVLKEYGYKTKTNQYIQGECVKHEIDVLAEKSGRIFLVEAKYNNIKGAKEDIQTIMYLHDRLFDIQKKKKNLNYKGWLFTNTKFTSKAIAYGKCRSIAMTGWKYSKNESLENVIESKKLYPVTILPAMNSFVRNKLKEADIYLAKDIVDLSADYLTKRGVHKQLAENIMEQAREFFGK